MQSHGNYRFPVPPAGDDGVPCALVSPWLSNGRGKAVANRDLWEQLAAAASRHETEWRWLRGHGSDPDQDRCDALAQESARTVAAGEAGRGIGGLTRYPLYVGGD
jgi:hypothetical protein